MLGTRRLALLAVGLLVVGQSLHSSLAQDSCVGRCGAGPEDGGDCTCNSVCDDYDDCCSDYESVCFTCQDRCSDSYDPSAPCHCNSECSDHNNCCSDYEQLCGDGSTGNPGVVTDQDLKDLSERLFLLEINNAGQYEDYDVQSETSQGGSDKASGPLFTRFESESIWALPTAALLYQMFDNYIPDVEITDDPEPDEENAFLDAVLGTPVMNEAYLFLNQNGYIDSQDDFRTKLYEMWFDPYERSSSNNLGSSGFEHVFIGESKEGKVSGFHGWYHFAYEEMAGRADYYGHLGLDVVADFKKAGYGGATMVFMWNGDKKDIGGFFIGTSPELDMAVKSVCWLIRAGKSCPMQYNNREFNIVTYNNDGKHIASAYPEF